MRRPFVGISADIIPTEETLLPADLLQLRQTNFALWNPSLAANAPTLVIGVFQPGNPNTLANARNIPLQPSGQPGLWTIPAANCGLADRIYHYWFSVPNTQPNLPQRQIPVTDPLATTVDWRLLPSNLAAGFDLENDLQPAAVIQWQNGLLSGVDPFGETPAFENDPTPDTLPPNNQLVIYELPTAWSPSSRPGDQYRAVGTFKDVLALVDENETGANFVGLGVLAAGKSYLSDLGVNALELLPPADSYFKRTWGYDTSHFLSPDWELGSPDGQIAATSNVDLAALVEACHSHGVRFFIDAVMAFGRNEAYQWIDFNDFYIADPSQTPNDPDALGSMGRDGSQPLRDGFGSTLFRYTRPLAAPAYDPISGGTSSVAPARALMYSYITRWMRDFRVDGVRMDSVQNVANWDFVGDYKNLARALFAERWTAAGLGGSPDARFIVVGEELSLPMGLLTQGRLDGLWNDGFRARVRAAIMGQNNDPENFEYTVRNAIDCRNVGFTDLAQAVNYVTSHDVEGYRRERLCTMLAKGGFSGLDLQKRVQLAFVCLLTANGIPMILAGEEFADEDELFDSNGNVTDASGKEIDPVHFAMLEGDVMRQAILSYVSRLVQFRTTYPALSVKDVNFIQVDFNDNKRVLVWQRGMAGQDPVVVVANFSDYATPNGLTDPNAQYVVNNWPPTPPGRSWKEVTQNRPVAPAQAGCEPIFPWEAKVYMLV
jgi:pullulanase